MKSRRDHIVLSSILLDLVVGSELDKEIQILFVRESYQLSSQNNLKVHTEGLLTRSVLVQSLLNEVYISTLLKLDHDSYTVIILRCIIDIQNLRELTSSDSFINLRNDIVSAERGKRSDRDIRIVILIVADFHSCSCSISSLTLIADILPICINDLTRQTMVRDQHNVSLRIINQFQSSIDNFPHIMLRKVGFNTSTDTTQNTIDQKQRNLYRKILRFIMLVVIGGIPVYDFIVVCQCTEYTLKSKRTQTALSVSRSCRRFS